MRWVNILLTDKLKPARSLAVDTFLLVLANNHVLEGGARLKDENGIGLT